MEQTQHDSQQLPTTEKQSVSHASQRTYRLISGSHEAQGPRKTMEDTHIRVDDAKSQALITNFAQVSYYGVYDGHGGSQTAKMVVDKLHPLILSSEHLSAGNITTAIESSFEAMDKYVVEEANKHNLMHGCTCVCCLVLDGTVYFANIGDSEGILVSIENNTVIPKNMTKPHKASDLAEKTRIESLGGHVFFGRVYGSLAVSRSFGDAKYKRPKTSKDFVSWEPHIEIQKLDPSHRYLILACDGLFDVMSQQEVAEMTHKLFSEGNDADTVAQKLVFRAIRELQTEDNVTVIVVKIDWQSDSETTNSQIPSDVTADTTTNTNTDTNSDQLQCSLSSISLI